MAQITTGIRSILSLPKVYQFLQNSLSKNTTEILIRDFIRPKPNDMLLDVGCGTAEILLNLPSTIKYVGFDFSEQYIKAAKEKHGERGLFICEDVSAFDYQTLGSPDIVLLMGVLHHLDDKEVDVVFSNIKKIKKDTTRILTIDPCFTESQNIIARLMAANDRGQNVRTPDAYKKLFTPHFNTVNVSVRDGLLRVPYTYCLIEAF